MAIESNQQLPLAFSYVMESGESIEFIPEQIKPFSFSDIEQTSGNSNASFKLEVSAPTLDFIHNGENIKGSGTVSGNITFHQKPKVYTLVNEGWLPPAFVSPPNLLVDRNVVSILSKVAAGSKRLDHLSTNWWMQFHKSTNLQVNPVLYALEGSKQKTPTFEEFCSAFDEATKLITKQLPFATVVSYSDVHYSAAYAVITDLAERNKREIKFLQEVAPILVNRCTDNEVLRLQNQVLSLSDTFGLNRKSFVVLSALACIYERCDGSGLLAARKIIKPKKNYSVENAFNALSDLSFLELYTATLALELPNFYLCINRSISFRML